MAEDKKLVCKDCGKEFTFTASEQEFYAEKGFKNDPVRCPECRKAKKNNFRKPNKRQETFRGQRSSKKMFNAVCSECGKTTQVPFKPKEDKPVYCRDCYNKLVLKK